MKNKNKQSLTYQMNKSIKPLKPTISATIPTSMWPILKKIINFFDFNIFAFLGFMPASYISACVIDSFLLKINKINPNSIITTLKIIFTNISNNTNQVNYLNFMQNVN